MFFHRSMAGWVLPAFFFFSFFVNFSLDRSRFRAHSVRFIISNTFGAAYIYIYIYSKRRRQAKEEEEEDGDDEMPQHSVKKRNIPQLTPRAIHRWLYSHTKYETRISIESLIQESYLFDLANSSSHSVKSLLFQYHVCVFFLLFVTFIFLTIIEWWRSLSLTNASFTSENFLH